MKESELC